MNPRDAWAIVSEVKRRLVPEQLAFVAKRVWRFIRDLHDAQQRFRTAHGKRKAALCSRRAGKSFCACAMLLEAAGDHPDSVCVYIALTREQARRILWRELKRFNRLYSLGLEFNETKLIATLRNGAQILLLGALNENDIDRIRGIGVVMAVIDEAASFPSRAASGTERDAAQLAERDLLFKLYREVLQPMMLDYQGTIVLLGTPAAHCRGFFYDVTRPDVENRRKGWEVFTWTVLDNPHVPKVKTKEIPDAETWLKRMCEEEGIDENDPAFQREWRARWIRSLDALVYRFTESKNTYREIPRDRKLEWHYGVSVDLGYDDPTVIGLFKWSTEHPNVYLTRVVKKQGMIPAQIAGEIKRWDREVGGLAFVVIDQGGGAGKMIAEEFRQRYGINCKGAEKTKKPTFIELLNGDLHTGKFQIHEDCHPVLDEISVLQWDPRYPGKKEDEKFANDACDMMLYGWRECRGYAFDEDALPDELKLEGTDKEEAEMEEQAERALKQSERDSEEWWR